MILIFFHLKPRRRRKIEITKLSFELRIIYETATVSTSLLPLALSHGAVRRWRPLDRVRLARARPPGQVAPPAPGFGETRVPWDPMAEPRVQGHAPRDTPPPAVYDTVKRPSPESFF